jgi:hypothetical protein
VEGVIILKVQTVHAGHGGRKSGNSWTDPGAVGNGYQEATVAREITAKMAKLMNVKDVSDNVGTSGNGIIYNQAASINVNGDGYHISNHLNAASNVNATGVEVLYGSKSEAPLAAKLSAAIAKALDLPDRGAKDGTWLGISTMTGSGKKVLLIEWAFISNPNDMRKLMANMDKGIAAAVKVLGYDVNEVNPTPEQPKPIEKKKGAKAMFVYTLVDKDGKGHLWGVNGNNRFHFTTKEQYDHYLKIVKANGGDTTTTNSWKEGSLAMQVVEMMAPNVSKY